MFHTKKTKKTLWKYMYLWLQFVDNYNHYTFSIIFVHVIIAIEVYILKLY